MLATDIDRLSLYSCISNHPVAGSIIVTHLQTNFLYKTENSLMSNFGLHLHFDKGLILAELDITPDLWFFDCHFPGDPVMPGCLGLDAMWQLVGFYLGWVGGKGKGRALGVGEVKFTGQILPTAKKVTYEIHMKRVVNRRLVMGLADGRVLVDGKEIYVAKDLKVGLFQDTSAF